MPSFPDKDNTIKNSFYARWWTSEEIRVLKKKSPDSVDEVANLCMLTGRLTRQLQTGKDELLVQLTAYLMRVMCRQDRGIVEVNNLPAADHRGDPAA